jgi:hypothetical protein
MLLLVNNYEEATMYDFDVISDRFNVDNPLNNSVALVWERTIATE